MWRNGHAICKDLGSSPTYDQRSFPPVTSFFSLNNHTSKLRSMPYALINQLKAIRDIVKHPTKKRHRDKGRATPVI